MHCFGVPVSDKYILVFSIRAELPHHKNFPAKNEYLQIKLKTAANLKIKLIFFSLTTVLITENVKQLFLMAFIM